MRHAFYLNENPFVKIIIPFISGILLFSLFPTKIPYSQVIIILLFIVLLSYHIYINKNFKPYHLKYWGAIFFVTLVLIGYNICCFKYKDYKTLEYTKQNTFIYGKIIKQPEIKKSSIKLTVEIAAIKINNKWEGVNEKCIVFIPNNHEKKLLIEIGDEIFFVPENSEISKTVFTTNSVVNLLLYQNTQNILKAKKYHIIKQKGISKYLNDVKNFIRSSFEKHIKDERVKAIANAIAIGYKHEMDYEIKQSYSNAGASHLLAVSGLHVGIIYIVFLQFFRFIKIKIIKSLLIITLLWLYALLTGMSPSVTRATLMFSLISIGKALKYEPNIYNIIAASAFIILLINPFTLFNIGFQLSYLAVIGIVFYYPKFKTLLLFKNKFLNKIWELICVTLAAQLFTAPFSIYYFNQFPTYFILSGIVLVPISPLVIYGYFLTVITFWNETLNFYLAKGVEFIVSFFNNFIFFIEKLPGSVIDSISINLVQVILMYLLIISLTTVFITKRSKYLLFSASIFLLFSFVSFYNKFKQLENRKVIIHNLPYYSAINFIDGKSNLVLTNQLKKYSEKTIQTKWVKQGFAKGKFIDINVLNNSYFLLPYILLDNPNIFYKKNFIGFYNQVIYILNKNSNNHIYHKKLNVDVIIVQNGYNGNIEYVLRYINPKVIVFDSSCKPTLIQNMLPYLQRKNVKYFICSLNGDFVINV
ncbi:MAG: ComEC family competence protein [Bacteroidales bacterium]|nr:ComEC family competence protein [Bacteroidales bacterium]